MKKLHLKLTAKQFETLREMLSYAALAAQSMTWDKSKDWELLERFIIGQAIRQRETD